MVRETILRGDHMDNHLLYNTVGRTLHDQIVDILEEELEYTNNNKSAVARRLDIGLRTVRHWVKIEPRLSRFKLERPNSPLPNLRRNK